MQCQVVNQRYVVCKQVLILVVIQVLTVDRLLGHRKTLLLATITNILRFCSQTLYGK